MKKSLTFAAILALSVQFAFAQAKPEDLRKGIEKAAAATQDAKKATKVAKGRLKNAYKFLKANDQDHFYEEMSQALWGYISDKLGLERSVLSMDTVKEAMMDKGIDEELSIGDYVLTSGDLPCMVTINAIARYLDGVLGSEESTEEESFASGLLEYPQYTRPQEFMGLKVPEVLVGGNHGEVAKWRREKQIEITRALRPDLLPEDKK